jgi:hypothetical protein
VAGSCEHCNGPSGSIKGEELLDQLSDNQFLRKIYLVIMSEVNTCY